MFAELIQKKNNTLNQFDSARLNCIGFFLIRKLKVEKTLLSLDSACGILVTFGGDQ